MASQRRRTIGVVIFLAWAGIMAMLFRRELGGERWQPETLSTSPSASSTWLGLYLAAGAMEDGAALDASRAVGQRIGHIHLRRQPETREQRDGLRFAMTAEMATELMGRPTDLSLEADLWRPTDGRGLELRVVVDSMDQTLVLDGELVSGEKGSELVATVESAGESLPLRFPVEDELLLQSGFGTATRFPTMEVGDDYRMASFDPLTLSRGEARIRCVAEARLRLGTGPGTELFDTKVLEVEAGGFESKVWVDAEGEVVRAETPFGMILQRLASGEAHRLLAEGSSGGTLAAGSTLADGSGAEDLLSLSAIRPAGTRPMRGARALEIEVTLPEGLELPESHLQRRLAEGRYRLEQPAEPADTQSASSGLADLPSDDPLLAADAFVQSDHPSIVEQARAIVGEESDPWRRAVAIHDWVFVRLDKVPVMSIPSALEVLADRRGDCNEHTVLFTALARAVDLPTRIAIGLVWSDTLDGFYYHAWPEVRIGDTFVRMDPTLGQPLADATHLGLLEGGIESWPRLLPFLGKLEITVVGMEGP